MRAVAAVSPGVLASTGIESAAVATALVRQLKPSCVVAIDALASRAIDRLCRTVQLSDTGIAPGSGVGNHRSALNRESLGVPVIPVEQDGYELLDAMCGISSGLPRQELPREETEYYQYNP